MAARPAIALGILANSARRADVRLLVYDRFSHYYRPDELASFLSPLIARGVFAAADLAVIGGNASFLEVFRRIHAPTSYGYLIKEQDQPVPDSAEEERNGGNFLKVPDGMRLGVCFIDGCKNWYGTRYFMLAVAAQLEPGAFLIFQDYGQHTCFWPSCLHAVLEEQLDLVACVDATHAFRLRRTLDVTPLIRDFPERAEDVSAEQFVAWYDHLVRLAQQRDDDRARVVYEVQKAAALAYIGHLDDARDALRRTADASWACGHEDMIRKARRSPTYRPGGEEVLL